MWHQSTLCQIWSDVICDFVYRSVWHLRTGCTSQRCEEVTSVCSSWRRWWRHVADWQAPDHFRILFITRWTRSCQWERRWGGVWSSMQNCPSSTRRQSSVSFSSVLSEVLHQIWPPSSSLSTSTPASFRLITIDYYYRVSQNKTPQHENRHICVKP